MDSNFLFDGYFVEVDSIHHSTLKKLEKARVPITVCDMCKIGVKTHVFNCGHRVCLQCGERTKKLLGRCYRCKKEVKLCIKLTI